MRSDEAHYRWKDSHDGDWSEVAEMKGMAGAGEGVGSLKRQGPVDAADSDRLCRGRWQVDALSSEQLEAEGR
jgi:hypothetical protein